MSFPCTGSMHIQFILHVTTKLNQSNLDANELGSIIKFAVGTPVFFSHTPLRWYCTVALCLNLILRFSPFTSIATTWETTPILCIHDVFRQALILYLGSRLNTINHTNPGIFTSTIVPVYSPFSSDKHNTLGRIQLTVTRLCHLTNFIQLLPGHKTL